MPTFLNLYHMLSVYKIIRAPKKGNCTNEEPDEDENCQEITFEEFQTTFRDKYVASHRKVHISKIKNLIAQNVTTADWNNPAVMHFVDEMSNDIMDHLVYTNIGYVCKKMLDKSHIQNCPTCVKAFSSCPENCVFPLATLIEKRTEGKLIYPNLKLFQIIKKINSIFNENVKKTMTCTKSYSKKYVITKYRSHFLVLCIKKSLFLK